jgi:hypothetical protein
MQFICTNAAALAVAVIYCVWRYYAQDQVRRGRLLRHRVAYMLWVAASKAH